MSETIDLVFSFDTTGSMYPCLTQVRRYVESTVKYLFEAIPNIRIGILTHGDYCDGDETITSLDLTSNVKEICKFIQNAPATNGGDADECYELVLNEARQFQWTSGRNKAFVMIGDANPHAVGYSYGGKKNVLDWKNELGLLLESGIKVFAVQALGRRESTKFYNQIAATAETTKLELDQFQDINDIICAICMSQAGQLPQFEETLHKRMRRPSFNILDTIDRLSGRGARSRTASITGLTPVHPSRFQILALDHDCSIKDFVLDNGLTFKVGRGFYEFTKKVEVQEYKEVIVQEIATGLMFSGDEARTILGIPIGVRATVSPDKFQDKYVGFIQSTSANRKLLGGTRFLYEVDEAVK